MVALNPIFADAVASLRPGQTAYERRPAQTPTKPATEGSALRRVLLRVSRSSLPAGPKAVLKEMFIAQGGERTVSISRRNLAEDTGRSSKAVQRDLAVLRRLGVVVVAVAEDRRKQLPPIYRLVPSKLPHEAVPLRVAPGDTVAPMTRGHHDPLQTTSGELQTQRTEAEGFEGKKPKAAEAEPRQEPGDAMRGFGWKDRDISLAMVAFTPGQLEEALGITRTALKRGKIKANVAGYLNNVLKKLFPREHGDYVGRRSLKAPVQAPQTTTSARALEGSLAVPPACRMKGPGHMCEDCMPMLQAAFERAGTASTSRTG